MKRDEFGGVYAAMVTPFDERGGLNTAAIEALVESLLGAGLTGICPVGTTGEFIEMSWDEKKSAVQTACRGTHGRGKVIAGVWADNARERRDLTAAAEKSGAHAAFMTTPVFYPATPESILSWYRDARRNADFPLFAYNIPQFTTNEIPLDVLEILAEEGTIQGYKDSSPSADRIEQVASRLRGKLPIFAGNEGLYEQALDLKFSGFISGLAGVFPKTVLAAWKGGRDALSRLAEIKSAVSSHGGIAALKYLLTMKGIKAGEPRELVAPLSDSDREALGNLQREFGPAEG